MSGTTTPSIFSANGSTSASSSSASASIQGLKTALASKTSRAVFEHCLGLSILQDVPALADNMIVVCLDLENWVRDQSRLTELGIATFDSRDMRALSAPGMHGEDLLKQVYFYHARIQENAHLVNKTFCVGNPDVNRFGQTRFVDSNQARRMLDSIFCWPIDESNPALGNCPVVIMGHSLKDDFAMLARTLGIRAETFDTVVKTVDTQLMCHETGHWTSRNQAGLSSLVSSCGFQYRDAHTACNDAAMTLIVGVTMVLPGAYKDETAERSLQDVVDDIEKASKDQAWEWGTDKYCTRCGSQGHTVMNYQRRPCHRKVFCEHCAASKEEKRQKAKRSHITENCIVFAFR